MALTHRIFSTLLLVGLITGRGNQATKPLAPVTTRAIIRTQPGARVSSASWSVHTTITSLGFTPSAVGLVAFDGSEPPSASVTRYDYFEVRRGTP